MKRHGVTLIELIIGISILVLVTLVTTNMYITTGRFNNDEQARTLVGVEASRLMSKLDNLLRQGQTVLAQYPPLPASATYTTGVGQLVFSVPSLMADGSLSSAKTDTAAVYLDTSNASNYILMLQVFPDTTSPNPSVRPAVTYRVATNVSSLYIRYDQAVPTAATSLTITTIHTRNSGGKTFYQAAILDASFRNHVI